LPKANRNVEYDDGSEDATFDEILNAKAEAHGKEKDLWEVLMAIGGFGGQVKHCGPTYKNHGIA
jgi:hypothetical protein